MDERFRRFLDEGGLRAPFEVQWARFEAMDRARGPGDPPPAAWCPGPAEERDSNLARLMAGRGLGTYADLHAWSVRDRAAFWGVVAEGLGIVFSRRPDAVLDASGGPENPRWFPGAALNIADSCFRGFPARTAILSGREGTREIRRTTLGELEALVNRAARGLRARGLAPGDAVALCMPMTVECVAAYLGVVRAGLAAVSIADSFPPKEVARRLEIARAKAVITVDSFTRAGKRVDLYARVREAGAPTAVVVSGEDAVALRPGDLLWRELLAGDASRISEPREPNALTNILFSSGTTGIPKAIPWTHLTPLKSAMDGRFHQDIRPGDTVAWPTNIGWMMGPWLIYASLLNGAAMALYEGTPGSEGFARFVGDAGVTMLGVVPSLVRRWRTTGAAEGADWSRVRVLSSTGEPSAREDYLWLMSRAGYRAPVIEYCGGTEIGGGHITGSVLQPSSPTAFTTPALGLDVLVLDGEGRPVGEGETGDLYLVPPSVGLSQALLNADHHAVYHEGCPEGPEGEVLRRHGDSVERLPGGFWRAHGRSDDTMNLGGIKVSSLEIEQALDGSPGVYECAAVGVQAGGEGVERLVLFVVPRGEPDPARLREDLGKRIARGLNPLFKVHDVVLVESLPRTASNKTLRRVLRSEYGR